MWYVIGGLLYLIGFLAALTGFYLGHSRERDFFGHRYDAEDAAMVMRHAAVWPFHVGRYIRLWRLVLTVDP